MCRIEWYKPLPGHEEFEGFIDFRDIREFRLDTENNHKLVDINGRPLSDNAMLSILYGKKFLLQKLSCIGKISFCFCFFSCFNFFFTFSR